MPMSWTPENDRLLLLKLVETHGITVNAEAIVKAWPDGTEKPSPRAIKERFVKLRALAGVKGKVSVSTPSKARVVQPKTPASSAKKRKMREDTESDADDHFTPEERTPTAQRKSAQRGAASRGRSMFGNKKGNGNGDDRVHIKTEVPDNASFNQLSTRATELSTTLNDPFDAHGMILQGASFANPLNGMQEQTYYGLSGVGDGGGIHNPKANGMDFNLDTYSGDIGMGMPVKDHVATSAFHPQLPGTHQSTVATTRTVPMINDGAQPVRSSVTPSDGSYGQRTRPARKASQQASDGMAAWLRQEKEQDHTYGERTSEEDSQGSEFHQSDDDYI